MSATGYTVPAPPDARGGRSPERLFLVSPNVDPALRAALAPIAGILPRAELDDGLASLAGARVRLDAATGAVALKEKIEAAGGTADAAPMPSSESKGTTDSGATGGAGQTPNA